MGHAVSPPSLHRHHGCVTEV
jgi:hypothetical protein